VKTLEDLGERKAIEIISRLLTEGNVAIGIGDDCAALEFNDSYLLVTTDMVSEKTHIPSVMTPWQIGWSIVAINLSDIAAKGGKPLGLVLSLGLPKNTSETFFNDIIKGADACAVQHSTSIIGGDTKENPHILLCGTAFGTVQKDKFMARKGAKPEDIIAITGSLGKAGAGYFALKQQLKETKLFKGLLEPTPRLVEGRALAESKAVTSCMDISDGLSSSLYQLQQINSVGFEIEFEQIPLSPMLLQVVKKESDLLEWPVHFGGDYELLVTLPQKNVDKAMKCIEQIGGSLTPIGKVTKEKKIFLSRDGAKQKLPNKGYEHFKPHHLL
jgi:thiamine-monophosphate kinase